MSHNDEFYTYISEDVFRDIPGITSKKMFGGYGFYKDDIFFAIIADNELYFKVDYSNKEDFINNSCHPFIYEKKDKKVSLSYWSVPESIMEDPDELFKWIEKSITIKKSVKK
jgi:DNA transformation protein